MKTKECKTPTKERSAFSLLIENKALRSDLAKKNEENEKIKDLMSEFVQSALLLSTALSYSCECKNCDNYVFCEKMGSERKSCVEEKYEKCILQAREMLSGKLEGVENPQNDARVSVEIKRMLDNICDGIKEN